VDLREPMPVCQLSAVSSRLSCTCKGGCAHLEFVWLLLLCHVLPAIPKSRIVESGLQGTTTHRQCNTSPPNRSSWTTQLPPPPHLHEVPDGNAALLVPTQHMAVAGGRHSQAAHTPTVQLQDGRVNLRRRPAETAAAAKSKQRKAQHPHLPSAAPGITMQAR
jgi:hypothetical protein